VEFDVSLTTLLAFTLALARTSAWVIVSPPFAHRGIPVRVRVAIAVALSLVLTPMIEPDSVPLDTAGFVGALVVQILVGLGLGFIVLLMFSAVTAAGGLIDNMAGFTLAQMYDPSSGEQVSVFGRYYNTVAITLLFVSNGYLLLVAGFTKSFEAVPLEGLDLASFDKFLVDCLGQFMVAALEIAAPVIAVLFCTEIAMGLLARAAPQLQIFNLAFPIRIAVVLGLTALAIPLVIPAVDNLVTRAATAIAGGG